MKKSRAMITLLVTVLLLGLLGYTAVYGIGRKRVELPKISSRDLIWQGA